MLLSGMLTQTLLADGESPLGTTDTSAERRAPEKRDNSNRKSASRVSLRAGIETGEAVLPGARHNTERVREQG